MYDLKKNAKRIIELINELSIYENYKNKLNKNINLLENRYRKKEISETDYKNYLKNLLRGKTKKDWDTYYNGYILKLLIKVEEENSKAYTALKNIEKQPIKVETDKKLEESTLAQRAPIPKFKPVKIIDKPDFFKLDKKTEAIYLKNLKITKKEIQDFIRSQKEETKTIQKAKFTVYKSNFYNKLANRYTEKITYRLIEKYPDFFKPLYESLRLADVKILSKTYISVMLFSTIIAFPIITLIAFLFFLNILYGFLFGILGTIVTFAVIYLYPKSLIGSRKKKIKNDLVFAIVHMAAVAGSGARPIKIFQLLLDSGEYKELGIELRKITNHVNIFGYSLSTSLRAVAATTPSDEFKELLNGMIATIETGGDLKHYLKSKADDALVTYKFDQKKYTEALSTYSDIYTGILVSAPLLFMVILTILDVISPKIGGISIATLSSIGVYLLLPLLNIAFIVFLNLTKPEL